MSFHSSDPPIAVVPGFLRPIDTAKIAQQLKLLQEGSKRGAEEIPKSNSTALDDVEQTILQKIQSEWAWQGDALIKNLRAYADRLVGYSISATAAALNLNAKNAQTRFENASVQAEGSLGPLKESFIAARDELRNFQLKRRIQRPARTPTGRWTTVGLLMVLISVESVLNGAIFAKGSQFGLVGGIGTAIGISLFNVVFAYLLGLGPARFVNYRNIIVRFIAVLITLSGILGLVVLHAFAAHYRDATILVSSMAKLPASPESRAFEIAIQTLMQQPWAIHSLTSIYLFSLGLLFAIGSFWKGYHFDDPHPFHGAMFRRSEVARAAYSDQHQLLFKDLEIVKEETVKQLESGVTTIPLYPQKASQIRAQRNAQLGAFRAYETTVEAAANQLLQIYRSANVRSRTSPAPDHFEKRWDLPYSFLSTAEVTQLTADPPDNEPDITVVIEELTKASNDVLSQYSQLAEKVSPSDRDAHY